MWVPASGIDSKESSIRAIAELAGPNYLDLRPPENMSPGVVVCGAT
jgi:hypothetical protein